MNRRGRERRGRPAPAPVLRRTEYAFAEVIADPHHPSERTLFLDGREAGQIDLSDPRVLAFAYMRRIADVIDALPRDGPRRRPRGRWGVRAAALRGVHAPVLAPVVFELDPGVVALAREHLGLRPTPKLRIKIGDAAELIGARPDGSAHLVIGDAFDGPDVPAQLSGPAFVAEVRRVLRPAGIYALNVIDIPPLEAVRAHDAVVGDGFAHVAWVGPPGVLRGRAPGNVVLLASAAPLPLLALRRAAQAAVPREQVLERARPA